MTYPTSPADERRDRLARGRHDAELLRFELCALRHRTKWLAGREAPVDDADEGDDAAVLVVRRVEDQRSCGRVEIARRRRDPLDDRIEHLGNADARLCGDPQHTLRRPRRGARRAPGGAVGIRLRKVDLVRDRNDLESAVDREIRVRQRLRLDPLRRVDDEERALARLQRARDLVREVDVSRGVDEVELMAASRSREPPGP